MLATEAAFVDGNPVAGDQITFNRIRIRIDNLPVGNYRVTHPYGSDNFQVTTVGRRNVNDTEDIGCICGRPCDFTALFTSRIGSNQWLKWDPAFASAQPSGYIGDPNIPHRVIGSPLGAAGNIFKIERANTNGTFTLINQTRLFSVSGKLSNPQPTP